MIQSASPRQFLAFSQGETASRVSSAFKKSAIQYERMLLPVSVCILLLMSLSLSLTVITTNAASSPLTVTHPSARPSLSSSPIVTVKHASSGNTTVGGETDVIPLTLI